MDYLARHHYRGSTATGYDEARLTTPAQRRKWRRELEIVGGFLRRFDAGCRVIDIPAGTGRALSVIEQCGHQPIAADISLDMLLQSVAGPASTSAIACEAEALPLADDAVDVVVCLRLFQHLPEAATRAILSEFGRVARRGLIVEAPLRQLVTPMVDLGRTLVGSRRKGSGLDRMFPIPSGTFRSLLAECGGFDWVEQGHVTWWGGQTKIILCRPKGGG